STATARTPPPSRIDSAGAPRSAELPVDIRMQGFGNVGVVGNLRIDCAGKATGVVGQLDVHLQPRSLAWLARPVPRQRTVNFQHRYYGWLVEGLVAIERRRRPSGLDPGVV